MATQQTKPDWQSATVWGLVIALLAYLKQRFEFDFTEAELEDTITTIFTFYGIGQAYWGRRRSKGPLKLLNPPPAMIGLALISSFAVAGCAASMPADRFEDETTQQMSILRDHYTTFLRIEQGIEIAVDAGVVDAPTAGKLLKLLPAAKGRLDAAKDALFAGDLEAAKTHLSLFQFVVDQIEVLVPITISITITQGDPSWTPSLLPTSSSWAYSPSGTLLPASPPPVTRARLSPARKPPLHLPPSRPSAAMSTTASWQSSPPRLLKTAA